MGVKALCVGGGGLCTRHLRTIRVICVCLAFSIVHHGGHTTPIQIPAFCLRTRHVRTVRVMCVPPFTVSHSTQSSSLFYILGPFYYQNVLTGAMLGILIYEGHYLIGGLP